MQVQKLDFKLEPNFRRVIALSYNIEKTQVHRIAQFVMRLSTAQREALFAEVEANFADRHRDLEKFLLNFYGQMEKYLPPGMRLNHADRLLLASYFTKEYSIEAAALFNPSIVPFERPTPDGDQRFVMSLRATGEGHISSVEFIQGKINQNGEIFFKMPESTFATGPERVTVDYDSPYQTIEMQFDAQIPLAERVIFPVTDDEINGIEDLRLVRFEDESGAVYFGTYTAYDGHQIQSKLLETTDFTTFRSYALQGRAVNDKGMALFPEKIDGQYAMISRQDGTNLYIMFSDSLYDWEKAELLMEPQMPWELTKVGNCGSPIKTEAGWLLVTHGVGPMRKYQLGAILLDLKNPRKIIARLKDPLLGPDESEREGYVPNVIYTCGNMLHQGKLIVPYAMSDSASGVAIFNLQEILQEME